jgi:two-component system sensor histidine kinase KdpD
METDIEAVIESALARLGEALCARRVVREIAPGLTAPALDPTLLEQALLNIVENAAAYGPAGSAIRIAARQAAEALVVCVEDEGPGIAPEALDQVFDRFRRLQRPSDRTQGLGLGLSIAKGFVEAMGGRIAAESPVVGGRGTRIVVTLPGGAP